MLPFKRHGVLYLLAVVLLTMLSACHDDNDFPNDPNDGGEVADMTVARTVLVYMVAENSLSSFGASDINEMLAAKSSLTPNDRLVIYCDGLKDPWLFVVTKKTKAQSYLDISPISIFSGERNSASAETFDEVLSYVTTHYAADEYGLVMWSHASGWIPSTYAGDAAAAPRRSFGIDNGQNTTSNTGNQMDIADMAAVLRRYPKMEFILFDCCFMQCVEVAYELKDCAKYLIASPAEIPGPGAPYTQVVPPMFADVLKPADIAQAYFRYYENDAYGSLLSVVDCSQMEAFAAYMHDVVQEHRQQLLGMDYTGVLDYYRYDLRGNTASFTDYYDMQGLMQHVLSDEQFVEWKEACAQVLPTQLHTPYWYSNVPLSGRTYMVDDEQYCGMSMFVPLAKYDSNSYRFNDGYRKTSWAQRVWYDADDDMIE